MGHGSLTLGWLDIEWDDEMEHDVAEALDLVRRQPRLRFEDYHRWEPAVPTPRRRRLHLPPFPVLAALVSTATCVLLLADAIGSGHRRLADVAVALVVIVLAAAVARPVR